MKNQKKIITNLDVIIFTVKPNLKFVNDCNRFTCIFGHGSNWAYFTKDNAWKIK